MVVEDAKGRYLDTMVILGSGFNYGLVGRPGGLNACQEAWLSRS